MAEGNEVQGRKEPTEVDVGYARVRYCDVCPDVLASAICVNCQEYMCTDCSSYHRRITATRGHTLLTGDEFSSRESPEPHADEEEEDIITKCPIHNKEEIKFYCEKHDTLCCVACNVANHDQCTKSYIHDIAENFSNGPEFGKLNTDMQDSDQLIVDSLADIDNCLKSIATLKAGEMDMLRKYRAKINDYLDRRQKELQAEMQHIHDQDVALLHELQRQLKTRQSELKEMRAKLESHEKNSSEIFIAAKRVCSQLAQMQSSLQETREKIGYQTYSIVQDTKMESIQQDKAGFASVERTYGKKNVFCSPEEDHNVAAFPVRPFVCPSVFLYVRPSVHIFFGIKL